MKAVICYRSGGTEELVGDQISIRVEDGQLWLVAWCRDCARGVSLTGECEPGYEIDCVLLKEK